MSTTPGSAWHFFIIFASSNVVRRPSRSDSYVYVIQKAKPFIFFCGISYSGFYVKAVFISRFTFMKGKFFCLLPVLQQCLNSAPKLCCFSGWPLLSSALCTGFVRYRSARKNIHLHISDEPIDFSL